MSRQCVPPYYMDVLLKDVRDAKTYRGEIERMIVEYEAIKPRSWETRLYRWSCLRKLRREHRRIVRIAG